MAPANPDEDSGETLSRVVAGIGVGAEFGGPVHASVQPPAENLATIRASIKTQIEWLDAIEAALSELRHLQNVALVEAAAVAAQLRTAITSSQPSGKSTKALWLCLYGCISVPFLEHYSSAVGSDLGHATALKIIQVLSSLSQHLNL